MNALLRKIAKRTYHCLTKALGRLSGNFYFEDYMRVYPAGLVYDVLGRKKKPTESELNNFKNHEKFYLFASQFVKDKKAADVGCGSGYGAKILKQAQASEVCACDVSKKALDFAAKNFSQYADFSLQSIINLKSYPDKSFDVVVCSEVLEHLKDYHQEDKAIKEIKRIAAGNGLIVVGTPNSEMMAEHGFYFDEIKSLLENNFKDFLIVENALVPFGKNKRLWLDRKEKGEIGLIFSQRIKSQETVLSQGQEIELKEGDSSQKFFLGPWEINPLLLHNTHSWVILALNNKDG